MSESSACSTPGCARGGATACAYVDRRSRRCRTAWCAEHRRHVEGHDYCRRHAGVVAALGCQLSAGLPEVDNRAASLASYLGAALDRRVTGVLGRTAGPGVALVNHPVRLVSTPGARRRRWQRTWNLVDATGIVSRVAIEVDESDDTVVLTSVGSSRIGRGTPPWIEHRGGGDGGPERRAAFVEAIGRSIELVLTRPEMAPTRV